MTYGGIRVFQYNQDKRDIGVIRVIGAISKSHYIKNKKKET